MHFHKLLRNIWNLLSILQGFCQKISYKWNGWFYKMERQLTLFVKYVYFIDLHIFLNKNICKTSCATFQQGNIIKKV